MKTVGLFGTTMLSTQIVTVYQKILHQQIVFSFIATSSMIPIGSGSILFNRQMSMPVA